jgi:hypothetical protein
MAMAGSTILQPIQPALLADVASGFLASTAASVIREWWIALSPLIDHDFAYSSSKKVGVLPSLMVLTIAPYAPSKTLVENMPHLLFSS